jgi:TetR/AcrR family transcriptional regulator
MAARSKPPVPVRDADASRARVWAAAADEFAARGFDGAKVDQIAAAARVNKAMIYYHFKSKAGLFNAILRDAFGAIADAVRGVRTAGGTPEAQLAAYVEAIASVAVERPFFPPIWLREIAEGGRHVDLTVAGHIRDVLMMLGEILREGVAAGTMRPVHPFLVQVGIVGPLTLFIASRPLRLKFSKTHQGLDFSLEDVVGHVQTMVSAGLATPKTVRKSR